MHLENVLFAFHKNLNIVSQKILFSLFPIDGWLLEGKQSIGAWCVWWGLLSWWKFRYLWCTRFLSLVLLTIHDDWRFWYLWKMFGKNRMFPDLCEVDSLLRVKLEYLLEEILHVLIAITHYSSLCLFDCGRVTEILSLPSKLSLFAMGWPIRVHFYIADSILKG